ncbi:MAG: succinyl-diaminopimelate desuccinylase [Pelagibacteraceae bacterium]|nr:succinyl-diaminopimelate desuccinylase [Pelagibacteraceae bacterium]|tara:strand:- start:263 stop:1429 length:1167 start_codon:yes stop_codon:yes gene_type:complete
MQDTIELAKKLISFESVTPAKQDIFDFLIKIFKEKGFETKQLNFDGDGSYEVINLFATFGLNKAGSNAKHFNFACHVDVVPPGNLEDWTENPFNPIVKDGYLYGRGSEDMKGCTAASIISTFKFIDNNPNFNGTISFIITGDEEADSINGVDKVVQWISAQGIRIDGSIATESSSEKVLGDQIKVGRKGAVDIHIEVIGKQGHAAYPQLAKNPVHGASKIISFFDSEVLDSGTEYYENSSIQFTQLNLNNKAKNVIPEKLKIVADMRFNDLWDSKKIKEYINNSVSKICKENGFEYNLDLIFRGQPFHSFNNEFTKDCVKAIKEVTGIDTKQDTGGGTSDARFIQRICPVFEFGTINKTLHKVDECVSVEDLKTTEKIYFKTLENFFS